MTIATESKLSLQPFAEPEGEVQNVYNVNVAKCKNCGKKITGRIVDESDELLWRHNATMYMACHPFSTGAHGVLR